MNIYWHGLGFNHTCGMDGTILEVMVSRDGGIRLIGRCPYCGEEFFVDDNMANIISKCTLRDFLRHKANNPDDLLANFVPVGEPS